MIAFLITAAVVAVMFSIVMQIHRFSTHRAGRIGSLSWPSGTAYRSIRRKLMPAFAAKILLVPSFIFAIPIKVLIVVAFRAPDLI